VKHGRVVRAGDARCVVAKARRTASAWERMRGLLGRPALADDEGLLIAPCPSVHTLGMRYPLDLAFLDAQGHGRKLVSALPPGRFAACAGAAATLELPPGALVRAGLALGDRLEWHDVSA
jgi:uncharacterized protein